MADDKTGGDDLFEDLDKFFAPIRDVDWESEEPSAPAAAPPQEEHVAVRPSETSGRPAPEAAATEEPAEEADEDEAWYDTSVLEPIDELLGSAAEDETDEEEEGLVRVEAAAFDDRSEGSGTPEAAADQSGLFDVETGEEEEPIASFLDDEDEGEALPDEEEEPTEEDIEAAAEHFAGSVRIDEEPAVATADLGPSFPESDLFGDEAGGAVEEDILSDLDEEGAAPRTVVVGADGLGGPSWQEPTAMEVGADFDQRGPAAGERDVPAAVLTGVVLAGIALGSLLIGKGAFAIVAAIVVLVAQGELFGVVAKQHHQPATAVGLVTGALMIGGAYYHGEPGILAMLALGVIATFLWFMASPVAHRRGTITNIGLTLMNIAYVPLLASYLIVTLTIGGNDGKSLVVAVIGLTFIFDTVAFLAGSVWGGQFVRRPLAPSISPKKSIEGLVVAALVTLICAEAALPIFFTVFEHHKVGALLLGFVVPLGATFGDLAESLVKRDLGIKDMGSVLPGHGGVLDRIDSLLFVAPAAFLLFRMIFT